MVATDVLLLVHAPPTEVLLKVVVVPGQAVSTPVIAAGNGFTVCILVPIQPVGNVYVIVGVPAKTPVTIPDEVPIVASAGLLLLHTPVPVVLVSITFEPTHTVAEPVMAAGNGLTVNGVVT